MVSKSVIGALSAALLSISLSTASAQPKPLGNPNAPQGGTFNVNLQVEPETLNPITSTDLYASQVHAYTLDSLMTRNVDTYEWEPSLAEKVETSKDGKSFTFTLRKGAKWHDGKPVTIEDVKFSYDCIFDPKYPTAHLRPYYENVEKVEVLDPNTIRFTNKNTYFQNFNVVASLTVMPKHVYGDADTGKKKNKTITGSGPYKLDKYDQGQSITLVRNKEWWGNALESEKGKYNFERIRMRFIKDSNIAVETLKKGDIDYDALTPEQFKLKTTGAEWGKSVFKVQTENVAPKPYSWIGWNLRRDMFKERDVRMALYHLLNRQEINTKFRFGMSNFVSGPLYPQSKYADPSVKPVQFDQKKALELLKKAGWTDSDKNGVLDKVINGKKTDFTFSLSYANKDTEKYWVLYQSDLKKVGIDMKLQLLEWNAFSKNLDEANFDAIAMGWSAGSTEWDPKQIWHSNSIKGGSNFIGYNVPEVDKLIDEARMEADEKKRIPLLQKVYKRIAEDVPYAFLFSDRYLLYAHSPKVEMPKPTFNYGIGTDYWYTKAK